MSSESTNENSAATLIKSQLVNMSATADDMDEKAGMGKAAGMVEDAVDEAADAAGDMMKAPVTKAKVKGGKETYKFDTPEMAEQKAKKLGCSGFHRAGSMFVPCASPVEFNEAMKVYKAADSPAEKGAEGLLEVEQKALDIHGGEIVESGFSRDNDMYVITVKRDSGDVVNAAFSGEGEELGWLKSEHMDYSETRERSEPETSTMSGMSSAVKTAEAVFEGASVVSGRVSEDADMPGYVIEMIQDLKSREVFIDVSGEKVLRFSEFDMKRDYDKDTRMSMADKGDALPDGSFPIADEADLKNAVQSVGRAKDMKAAKSHIMKRAKELDLMDVLPDGFTDGEDMDKMPKGEKTLEDPEEFLKSLEEFEQLVNSE